MSDPQRLLESAATTELERTLLESASPPGPTEAQVDQSWTELALRVGSGIVTGGIAGSTSHLSKRAGAIMAHSGRLAVVGKGAAALAVACALGTLGATGLAHLRDLPSASAPSANVILHSSPAALGSVPTPAATRPIVSKEEEAAVLMPSAAPTAIVAAGPPLFPSGVAVSSSATSTDSSMRVESELVLRSRAAVRAGTCEAALTELNEVHERFPAGVLKQERDALYVEALACAGRNVEAAQRAMAFSRDYPESPYMGTVHRFSTAPGSQ